MSEALLATQPLEVRVGDQLRAHGLTLAVAESCTGGLLMHLLTNVAGSSAFLLGGIVAYAYEPKVALLGVNQDELVQYGAVSEVVAAQMARGARKAFGADLAVSITGIAGPGGGMPGKPVGLTYIGLDAPDTAYVIRRVWPGNREENKRYSADAALELLLEYLARRNRA